MKAADLVIFELNASQYILTKDNKSCNVFLAKFLPEKKTISFGRSIIEKCMKQLGMCHVQFNFLIVHWQHSRFREKFRSPAGWTMNFDHTSFLLLLVKHFYIWWH